MDPVTHYHDLIDAIIRDSGMSDKMLHVHAGLAIYCLAQLVLRTRRGSVDALLAVVLVEGINEALDRLFWGDWRPADTLGDIASTLFWPTALLLLSRLRRRRYARKRSATRLLVETGLLGRPAA